MELKTNNSHKKLDLRNLDLKKAKRLGLDIGLTSLTLLMLSGCGKKSDIEYTDTPEPVRQEYTMEEDPHEDIREEVAQVDQVLNNIDNEEHREYNIVEHSDDEVVENADEIIDSIKLNNGKYINSKDITYGDLKNATSISINIKDGYNYEFLNHIPNVVEINIYDYSKDINIDNVDGSRISSGVSVNIVSKENNNSFNRNKYNFLGNIDNISCLNISSHFVLDSDYIQDLKQVNKLCLKLDNISNFKYKDLTYLESLEITGKTHNVAMYLSTKNIEDLENSSVDFKYGTEDNDIDKLKEVTRKIDGIVNSLNVDENATDQEKLNAILEYVLNEYDYDEEIGNIIRSGEEVPKELIDPFYEGGELYGSLEKDSQICGNFAGMTSTLCNRLGVESYDLTSSIHAWVLVKIGDYYYYCDPTYLDDSSGYVDVINYGRDREGNIVPFSSTSDQSTSEEIFTNKDYEKASKLRWYLVDPTEVKDDSDHVQEFEIPGVEYVNIPEDIENEVNYKTLAEEAENERKEAAELEFAKEDVKDLVVNDNNQDTKEEIQDITNKKAVVKINGKTIIISASALVGILSALGIGKLIHDKKERDRIRHRNEVNDMFNNYNSYNGYTYNGYKR